MSPARPRTAASHSRPSLLFCRQRGMETNCRKLVSACVQLGKIASPSRPPDGRLRHARAAKGHRPRSETLARGASLRGWPGQEGNKAPGAGGLSCGRAVDREGDARRVPKPPAYSSLPEPLTAGVAPTEDSPCARWPENRRDRVPSVFPSNWVFALCPSFSSVFPHPLHPLTPRLPNARCFPRRPGASFSPHVGRARAAQACSRRPLNASSPKTPKSKRSSSRTLPRAGKRRPAASSSRGSILAPMVRPGAKCRPCAGHPPLGLWAS